MVRPKLPEDVMGLRIKRLVLLEIKIDEAGSVHEIRLIQGDSRLIGAAEEAVRQWKYEPHSFQGKPIAMWSTVVVDFDAH